MFVLNDGKKDGAIDLTITLEAEEVSDALAKAYFDIVTVEAIPPHDGMSAYEACVEKLGETEAQKRATDIVMQQFIPLACDRAFVHMVGLPHCESETLAEDGCGFSYKAHFVYVPEMELTSYQPIEIEAKKPVVSDESVVSFMTELVSQMGGTLENEWISQNVPGCKTVDDLMIRVRAKFEHRNDADYEDYCIYQAMQQIAERLEGEIPAVALDAYCNEIVCQFAQAAGQRDMRAVDIAASQGITEEELHRIVELQAKEQLSQEISLDAFIRHEGLSLTEEDVAGYLCTVAPGDEEGYQLDLLQQGGMFRAKRAALHMKACKMLIQQACC